ncbi:MAG: zinc permease [Algoriphagus sp.]|jgi:zinc and cadmium transporter|uniref:zinc permease n=1 Tax=Algoriphagus sp. TaxID=1872435 RepID=UPI002775D1DE|nr:zinc permease [Algoriphagus sp.]MDP4747999.1 zinc permease [Algoriphagus sp.]MDP4839856.1 zinc permease [Algoriphagus sp.]MDP4905226.1 zinc permease [Algoriphagus sp.]MDP4958347.1 zinc permease [Algoriphagus sp.]
MVLKFSLLFFTAIFAGLVVYTVPTFKEKYFKLALVFAGSYLFSITILHILPELFSSSFDPSRMGVYILLGFLLQQLLEFWSAGIEHGHIHSHHATSSKGVLTLMIGLFVHAFLEGTLLSHGESVLPQGLHAHSDKTILMGILLHKAPAAFALAAVLSSSLSKRWTLVLLSLFALASPIGMISSSFFIASGTLSTEGLGILFGLVTGGFLHISTTIFFESSPHHTFQLNKLAVTFLAAALAIASEYFI